MSSLRSGEPLSLAHQRVLTAALQGVRGLEPPGQALSDLSFANLYLFRQVHDYRYRPGPWPCLSGRSYDGAAHLLPLFDLRRAPVSALRELLHGAACFFPLSATQVQGLDPAVFEWSASRDDADYLYPAGQFRHYRGTALNKKRNLVSQLHAAHALSAQPYDASCAAAARTVLADWMAAKGKAPGQADEVACLQALELAQALGLQGFLYRADGEAAGFVLAQPLAPGVWAVRFAKGLARLKGIYQHMFQHLCLARPDVQWLNFEQDLGIASLRKTKLSYQPALLLAKYRVSLRVSHLAQDSAPA